MNKSAGRGPRPGRPDTREEIRQAARTRFIKDGYQSVTLRAIAADAGVDVALVSYYFGSKQSLFAAALALPVNPAEQVARVVQAGPPETLASRLLPTMLAVWDAPDTGPQLQTLAAATLSDPDLARLVREAVAREIVGTIAHRLGGTADAKRRAGTFVAQMTGVIFSRYLLRLEPIASMPAKHLVTHLAPALQVTLTAPT